MKPEELAEEFAQNVSAQTDAIWNGDAKTGNKHAKRYVAAFKKLRHHGDTGRDALAVLLKHPRDGRARKGSDLSSIRTADTGIACFRGGSEEQGHDPPSKPLRY